jgi:Fic family protein
MSREEWNWEQEDWPEFRYIRTKLDALEAKFLREAGEFIGAVKHVVDDDKQQLTVDLISDEAFNTSEIEGEILNRESLQSSIRRNFGLAADNRKIPPAEQGIAEMRVDLYRNFNSPLSDDSLFHWHKMLMNGRRDLKDVGRYRSGNSPMQIVSGPIHEPKVHFEAPPATRMRTEMARFIKWFNQTSPAGKSPLPVLTRAGITHWHFVAIHPFEDGNGRIARALAEKAISQSLGQPTLIALSHVINSKRKTYYEGLELGNRQNEITDWLVYFAQTILGAQSHAQRALDFIIAKAGLFARLHAQINARQEKALLRMFREGPDGFQGGLSADNYIRITGASRATATRDLHDLVEKNALTQTGTLKSTRYHLNVTTQMSACSG